MSRYIEKFGEEEGKREMEKAAAQKVSSAAKVCMNYPYSHLADVMGQQVGYRALLRELSTLNQFRMAIKRETDYAKAKQGKLPYLRVEIHGRPYAFRLVKSDRNFILEEELIYCNKVGIQPVGPPITASPAEAATPVEPVGASAPAPVHPASHPGGTFSFSYDDLLLAQQREIEKYPDLRVRFSVHDELVVSCPRCSCPHRDDPLPKKTPVESLHEPGCPWAGARKIVHRGMSQVPQCFPELQSMIPNFNLQLPHPGRF